jgi:hypothetical protein
VIVQPDAAAALALSVNGFVPATETAAQLDVAVKAPA